MPDTRIPASVGAHRGELRLTPRGLAFVPVTSREGDQMCLDLSGWHLDWSDVVGLERVMSRPGDVRVHHDAAARFMTVSIHGSLQGFFDAADAQIAAAASPAHRAA